MIAGKFLFPGALVPGSWFLVPVVRVGIDLRTYAPNPVYYVIRTRYLLISALTSTTALTQY